MRWMIAFLTLALGAPLLYAGISDAEWKEKVKIFKDDFKKKSIVFKMTAIEGLPLTDERTIEFIIEDEKLLCNKDSYIRELAADRLGKIKDPELRKKLYVYAEDRDKRIREGILCALALSRDRLDPPVIIKGLQDPAWEVRRMACWAAGRNRVVEAVDPMIDMIHEVSRDGEVIHEGEKHPRVHSVLLFNLQEITGVYFHTDVQQWKSYWEQNKDKTLPPVKRFDTGTFGDIKLDLDETYARKGHGPLVIALPGTHKLTTYYMPYFNQWLFVRWIFINLPPITSFPDVQINEHGDPVYPVDLLVDAFEDLRKQKGVDKMAVLAQGFTTWVAAKYAQKYPDRVSGLILLNPYASNETYGKHIDEALRSGDADAEFWAKVSRYEIKISSPREGERYAYYVNTEWPEDKSDIEMAMLKQIWHDPNSTSIEIPPFDIRGEDTSRTPVLMFFSPKDNKLTGYGDMGRLKKYYPNNIIVKLSKSAWLPFMEEPEKFEEALRLFVDRKLGQ